jgi:predicted nuclease with TOPRIM domain
MSSDGPEFQALRELEDVLKHLTDELAAWRRRALKAEGERAELGADHDVVASRERIVELERENRELQERVERARKRVTDLLGRMRFLEEQVTMEESGR